MKKSVYFKGASNISVEKLASLPMNSQDGAIWGGYLFAFNARGECCVFNINDLSPVGEFYLDKRELICPHSNAVVFGCEYYEDGDEFPLLYTNVYNNYSNAEDRREGMVCVSHSHRIAYFQKHTCSDD